MARCLGGRGRAGPLGPLEHATCEQQVPARSGSLYTRRRFLAGSRRNWRGRMKTHVYLGIGKLGNTKVAFTTYPSVLTHGNAGIANIPPAST